VSSPFDLAGGRRSEAEQCDDVTLEDLPPLEALPPFLCSTDDDTTNERGLKFEVHRETRWQMVDELILI